MQATRYSETEAIDILLEIYFQHQKLLWKFQNVSCMLHVNHALCVLQLLSILGMFFLSVIIINSKILSISISRPPSDSGFLPQTIGIEEVYYGCSNDKFGGCGSILSLHSSCSEQLIRFIFELQWHANPDWQFYCHHFSTPQTEFHLLDG